MARVAQSGRINPRYIGGSTLFNGSTSKITLAGITPLYTTTGTYTFSAWVKPSYLSAGEKIILSGASGRSMFGIETNAFVMWVDTDSAKATIPLTFKYEEWMFLSWETNMTNSRTYLYKNGVYVGTAIQGVYVAQDQYITRIGCYAGDNRFFVGNICEVKTYNGSFTAEQHKELYTTGSIIGYTPLASYLLSDLPSTYIDTIGGNNGTGTATAYSSDVPLQLRQAIDNDARSSLLSSSTGHCVTVGTPLNAAINTAQAYTVMCSVKRSRTIGTLQSFFGESLNDKWWFNFLTNNTLRIYHADLSPNATTTTLAITNTLWHHVAATYNGSRVRIYVDGLLVAEQPVTGTLNLNQTMFLLAFSADNNFLGNARDYKLYNRELTRDEIVAEAFSNAAPRNGLIGEWVMNEGAGSIVYDTSGNGNNGTISGATWSAEVPSAPREMIGGNLVKNGDFDMFDVNNITTTAGGALNNTRVFKDVANITPTIVDGGRSGKCLRITFNAASSYGSVSNCDAIYKVVTAAQGYSGYLVKPNTEYTISGYVRTSNIAAGRPIELAAYESNESAGSVVANKCTAVSGTKDWTFVSKTFTTASTTTRIRVFFYNDYDTTADRNVDSYADFDDITILPTTPTNRTAI